jgi:sulfur-oxidizing protein SoxY
VEEAAALTCAGLARTFVGTNNYRSSREERRAMPIFRSLTFPGLLGAVLAAAVAASPALAGPTWDSLKPDVFGARQIEDGRPVMSLKAPYRPEDQRAVPISAEARFTDGRTIKSVTFVVDENPSPVAAVVHVGGARERVSVGAKFRLNRESDVRAIVEASDGRLYMVEQRVKFAGGQAACSAPPTGDPLEIAANMGRMQLTTIAGHAERTDIHKRLRLDVSHPNHTGMVQDPLSLLYIPLLMVQRIELRQGDELAYAIDGSITLAQDPSFELDIRLNGAERVTAHVADTGGGSWSQSFAIGAGS